MKRIYQLSSSLCIALQLLACGGGSEVPSGDGGAGASSSQAGSAGQGGSAGTTTVTASPTVDTLAVEPFFAGTEVSVQLVASGGTGGPYTWSFEGELPDGLTLSESGLLSGAATAAAAGQESIVQVVATDKDGKASASVELKILVGAREWFYFANGPAIGGPRVPQLLSTTDVTDKPFDLLSDVTLVDEGATQVGFSPDGRFAYALVTRKIAGEATNEQVFFIADLIVARGEKPKAVELFKVEAGLIMGLSWSPDASKLAYWPTKSAGQIRVVDVAVGADAPVAVSPQSFNNVEKVYWAQNQRLAWNEASANGGEPPYLMVAEFKDESWITTTLKTRTTVYAGSTSLPRFFLSENPPDIYGDEKSFGEIIDREEDSTYQGVYFPSPSLACWYMRAADFASAGASLNCGNEGGVKELLTFPVPIETDTTLIWRNTRFLAAWVDDEHVWLSNSIQGSTGSPPYRTENFAITLNKDAAEKVQVTPVKTKAGWTTLKWISSEAKTSVMQHWPYYQSSRSAYICSEAGVCEQILPHGVIDALYLSPGGSVVITTSNGLINLSGATVQTSHREIVTGPSRGLKISLDYFNPGAVDSSEKWVVAHLDDLGLALCSTAATSSDDCYVVTDKVLGTCSGDTNCRNILLAGFQP